MLDLIRGKDYERATEVLEFCDREVATVIGKLLRSAAANAVHNDGLDPEELFVSACFADEGTTLKRWRPRARGRATRIRKRTCHVTVILSRMPDAELNRRRARVAAEAADRRARRVAGARRQGRAAAAGDAGAGVAAGEPVDERLLEIVAAGDQGEPPEIEDAVEQALADDETAEDESTDETEDAGDEATDGVEDAEDEATEDADDPATDGVEDADDAATDRVEDAQDAATDGATESHEETGEAEDADGAEEAAGDEEKSD